MRRLIAALACRIGGSRLFGKPLQLLDIENRVSVLDHQITLLKTIGAIDEVVLGIAEGKGNDVFEEVAKKHEITFVVGSERDVLSRLIMCAEEANGTDVFRVTTESPFTYFEEIDRAWSLHVERMNDVTVIDGVPEGSHFEIYALDSLRRSHDQGEARHRSEFCSLYIREHRSEFKVDVIDVPAVVSRLDLRLTIDNPEDLVLCRAVYSEFAGEAPRIPLQSIIRYLDGRADLRDLVRPFVVPERLY